MTNKKKTAMRAKWELYLDASYFDMWAVREKGDRDFNSPRLFHFAAQDDAAQFKSLIERSYHAVRSL